MDEFNKRQLIRLLEYISSYHLEEAKISALLSTIDNILNIMEGEEDLKESIKGKWWDIEQIYAYNIEYNNGKIEERELIIVRDTLEAMKSLINTAIHK